MNAPDRKFTDHTVRTHPELRTLAENYARTYDGEFEFLLNVRHRLEAEPDARLSTSTIRGVLNCMRYDPLVSATMPEPGGVSLIQRTPKPVRHLQPVPDYRPPVSLKTTFHKQYLLNVTPKMPSNDPKAHILNHARSRVRVENGRMIYFLIAWCGWNVNNYGRGTSTKAKMSDDTEGRQVCGSCTRLIQKAGRAL